MIDSKVSLVGYLRAHEEGADDGDPARRDGRPRAAGARPHPDGSARRRTGGSCRTTPEFVVMFLHDESSWLAALDVDPIAPRARAVEQRDPRLADEPDRPAPRRPLRLAAGDDRRGRPRRSATSAASSTSGSRRWARTSRSSAARSTAPSSRTTRRSARSSGRCCRRRAASSSTGSPAIEPPELSPIERQTRALSAQELVGDAAEGRSRSRSCPADASAA